MGTIDGTEWQAVTIDGEDVKEITVDGDVVWTGHEIIEDFGHADLDGRYTNTMPNGAITTSRAYYNNHALHVPSSSDAGTAIADTAQFSDTLTSGASYRFPYYLENDGAGQRIRLRLATDGSNPTTGGGYDVRMHEGDFVAEAWSTSGTQTDAATASVGSVPYSQWDYIEVSYANAADAGSASVQARLITGGSTDATLTIDAEVTASDEWIWTEDWGWDTVYYGGFERL